MDASQCDITIVSYLTSECNYGALLIVYSTFKIDARYGHLRTVPIRSYPHRWPFHCLKEIGCEYYANRFSYII